MVAVCIAFSALYVYFAGLRTAFVPFAFVDGFGVSDAISESYEITRGNPFALSFILVLCIAVFLAGCLFFVIGLSITAPIVFVIYCCAYLYMRDEILCLPEDKRLMQYEREEQTVTQYLSQNNEELHKKEDIPQKKDDDTQWLGKGTDISDYSGLDEKIIERSKEKK
jgi:hypothetical protein